MRKMWPAMLSKMLKSSIRTLSVGTDFILNVNLVRANKTLSEIGKFCRERPMAGHLFRKEFSGGSIPPFGSSLRVYGKRRISRTTEAA